jgi:hypothetical protein
MCGVMAKRDFDTGGQDSNFILDKVNRLRVTEEECMVGGEEDLGLGVLRCRGYDASFMV